MTCVPHELAGSEPTDLVPLLVQPDDIEVCCFACWACGRDGRCRRPSKKRTEPWPLRANCSDWCTIAWKCQNTLRLATLHLTIRGARTKTSRSSSSRDSSPEICGEPCRCPAPPSAAGLSRPRRAVQSCVELCRAELCRAVQLTHSRTGRPVYVRPLPQNRFQHQQAHAVVGARSASGLLVTAQSLAGFSLP